MIQVRLVPLKDTYEYIKSPLNYTGGKYKYLEEIIPLMNLNNAIVFYDVFGGGFNVGLNTPSDTVHYNDLNTPIMELLEFLKNNQKDYCITYIHNRINEYGLSKTDKESFKKFREDYNKQDRGFCPLDLFILSAYSFNHQIRFNNKGDYNSSHGTNRSSYNKNMENNLIKFIDRLHSKEIFFSNKDFKLINYTHTGVFYYFDPPYYLTNAVYNDGNRGFKNWTDSEEKELYGILTSLNNKGIRFGLNNLLYSDNNYNSYLKDFIDKNKEDIKVYPLNTDYSNSNYHKKDKGLEKEVYITNI